MHYCIGDVHGCYDEMVGILGMIEKKDKDAKFIFVGDFVDRGPKVWETINWAMENVTADGKYQTVQGNHEQMVLQWYVEYCQWKKKTIRLTPPPRPNYDFMDMAKARGILDVEKLAPIMDFFTTMPFHKVISVGDVTYDIVHAWYNFSEPEDSPQQFLDNLWQREVGGNWENDHVIIHGHTPTLSGIYGNKMYTAPGMITYRHNDINIDGGCVFNGMRPSMVGFLCGICLETLEEFYYPDINIRFPNNEDWEAYKKKYLPERNPFREEILARL